MQNVSNYSSQEGIIISLEDFLAGINDRTSGKGIKQMVFIFETILIITVAQLVAISISSISMAKPNP